MVRSCVLALNTPIAKRRLLTELNHTERPLWLEIGGLLPRNRWLITDAGPVTRFYLDATRRWPIETNSVEYLFSDNVIEHLTLEQGRAMLEEARRCIQPGGVVRIVTPDLRTHVEMYLKGRESLKSSVALHYRDIGLTVEHPVDLVRVPVASFGHHEGYLYDFDTMASELTRVGFTNVIRCDLGISAHTAMRDLDLRGEQGSGQMAVEATA
jgi:hypothetical protein